jgi:ATP-dependent DNA helicase RecG
LSRLKELYIFTLYFTRMQELYIINDFTYAIYHRDYQVREPVEVRIYPDSIVILNYGGPDRSIKTESFKTGMIKPRRYRNRRLGDFLKELELTEGRATGIPRIKKALKENGSPDPFFDFDEERTYFEVDFYIHPAFKDEIGVDSTLNNPDLNGGLNDGQQNVLRLIQKNEGIKVKEISIRLNSPIDTVDKQIKVLIKKNLIERQGSKKTGGYYKKTEN